ncbi:MAG: PaaI family thioesterase [Candidatus Caldatribacteriaceae bacterium]
MPFVDNRQCFFCGERNPYGLALRFTQNGEWTETDVQIPWYLQGFEGVAHGGIVASLLDEVMSHSVKRAGLFAVTGTLEVRYQKPCPTERLLRVRGKVQGKQGRIVEAWGEILYDGERVAEGKGIFVILKGVSDNG